MSLPEPELVLGEAAEVLATLPPASVDMVYADPPFGNEQLWTGMAGAFDDRWTWKPEDQVAWDRLEAHVGAAAAVLWLSARSDSARAYLAAIIPIVIEARRILRPTGALWLHFDSVMGAQLRVLGDLVFGPANAAGLVIWKRTSSHDNANRFGRVHDTIAVWARTRVARWRLARCRDAAFTSTIKQAGGEAWDEGLVSGDPIRREVVVDGLLLDDQLNARSAERVGYPTQKPLSLLEKLIAAATLPGDLVVDPVCGSGTAVVAAWRLGRRAIGIDRSPDAIAAATGRLTTRKAVQTDLFG